MKPLEREIKKQVNDYFKVLGIPLKHHNVGKFISQDGKRTIYVGTKGDPDYTGSYFGRRVWVEVKRPNERPKLHQTLRMIELNQLGDFAVWLDDIKHVLNIVDALRLGCRVEMETNGDYYFVKPAN